MTLLDRYGPVRTTRAITEFYEDVLADPLLGHFFDRVSISELAEHQAAFLRMILGGEHAYTQSEIQHAHSALAIGREEFDAMIGHLTFRLRSNGFSPGDVIWIIGVYREYESVVIGHGR